MPRRRKATPLGAGPLSRPGLLTPSGGPGRPFLTGRYDCWGLLVTIFWLVKEIVAGIPHVPDSNDAGVMDLGPEGRTWVEIRHQFRGPG